MKEFGELVRAAREARGLKAYELAARLDRQPSFVSRIEQGHAKTLPTPEELVALSAALAVPVADLVRAAGYPIDGATEPTQAVARSAVSRLVRDLDGLSEGQLAHIQQLVDMMHGRPLS